MTSRVYILLIVTLGILQCCFERTHGLSVVRKGENKSGVKSVITRERTFKGGEEGEEGSKWSLMDNDKLDYGTTGVVFGPIIFLLVGALAVPYEGTDARSLDGVWTPISLVQEILQGTQCIERISCQLSKTPLGGFFEANQIQRKLQEFPIFSHGLVTRISRSFRRGTKPNATCLNYSCKALDEGGKGKSILGFGMPEFDRTDTLWDRFLKYFGGRYLFVRKLAANKGVNFYPYLPSVG